MHVWQWTGVMLAGCMLAGCARTASTPVVPTPPPVRVTEPEPRLPEIPPVTGPLRLTVVYPPENAQLTVVDSNFVFGSTGSGGTTLRINGRPVEVAPNGAFLAFLPVPADGVYRLEATLDGQTATLQRTVRLPATASFADSGAVIVPGSAFPAGSIALPAGEPIEVGFVGTAGGRATLFTPYGARYALIEQPIAVSSTEAGNFRREAVQGASVPRLSRYSATIPLREMWAAADTAVAQPALSRDAQGAFLDYIFAFRTDTTLLRQARERGLPVPTPAESASIARYVRRMEARVDSLAALGRKYLHLVAGWASFELIVGTDTVRAPLNAWVVPLDASVPRTAVVRAPPDAPADWTSRGRPGLAGPYHWFWPSGTRLDIDGERSGSYRVRLTSQLAAWVPSADVELLPPASPLARASVAGVRMTPHPDRVDLRIATALPLPFHVEASERALDVIVYGATSEVNFLQYGSLDPLIERASWSQPASDMFVVHVQLTQPLWGYQTRFDETGALIVSIRRPPLIADEDRPLEGLLIAVDPGHPPAGATGPTGLYEARANLDIALRLKPLLEQAGARVLMTRVDDSPVELGARPRLAAEMNAHLFVSIHNNAFPDGVNPFENHGSSVYYFHPHSQPLARAVQAELTAELGTRDLGIGRADLAVARITWMPAILSETMFLMIPQQEAALRDPEVQRRIAEAHLRGIEAFVRAQTAAARER